MPIPGGEITTSQIWVPAPEAMEEEANIPFEPRDPEEETKEEE